MEAAVFVTRKQEQELRFPTSPLADIEWRVFREQSPVPGWNGTLQSLIQFQELNGAETTGVRLKEQEAEREWKRVELAADSSISRIKRHILHFRQHQR